MRKITLLLVTLFFNVIAFAQFPSPYCGPLSFTSNVEPITLVNFAGINNITTATVGSGASPAHEDFTALTGNVVAGSSYTITLKGNTDGPYENSFIVFADWNQDGDFADTDESYPITQTIYESTGNDAIQATQLLLVPPTALAGSTRIRVKKIFGSSAYTDPCAGTSYGQAEDYTVSVTIPSCLAPSALNATVLSSTSVTLSWQANGGESLWNIEWGVSGFTPGTGTMVNGVANPYSVTTVAATVYQFYVQANCGAGNLSTWSGPFSFDTTIAPGCSTVINPANGATNVATGDVTFSWTAPSTGDPAVSYDMYYGTTPGDVTNFVGNFTTTTADINLSGFNQTFYWTIVPVNSGGEATGCAVWSFTTAPSPGYCLSAVNGQWPSTAYTPATCDGVTVNDVTTNGWAGEYSVVNVTAGETYRFESSVPTDFITISTDDGATAAAYGTTSVLWTATVTGPVRFYTHLDDQCGDETVSRTRSVVCGASLSTVNNAFSSLKVYPNPVKDVLNLSHSADLTSVEVFNMLGQKVAAKSLNTAQGQIDMSNLANGTYVVKIATKEETKSIKVVKQ